MPSFLRNHPFAVEAFFESSLVLTYAVEKEELQNKIPDCLELDTLNDTWAFIAVAMVQTKNLRPKGFPQFLGNDFFLAGYRIFVRYTTSTGKRLRGLYIIKSETDKKKMVFFGNMFTHYRYTLTDIECEKANSLYYVQSDRSGLNIEVELSSEEEPLPPQSPFRNWKEARRFAGPLPFTFTYNTTTREVLIIEGVRENWMPKPVMVRRANVEFVNQQQFGNVFLANAFILENIPYYWKKGKIDIWKE